MGILISGEKEFKNSGKEHYKEGKGNLKSVEMEFK